MRLGFTGTRYGMTEEQKKSFVDLIKSLRPTEFHHGDCVGADNEAADLVAQVCPECLIVCHPPIDESHRAFNTKHREIREPRTHFARNRNIVDGTDMLVGCPVVAVRQDRGGTWYTMDYAGKKGKDICLIGPDGEVEPYTREN